MVIPSFSVRPAWMAMIFERTMMFGLTLRNDMPTRSRMPTLASVILAWIQRLKYFANRMNEDQREEADDGEEGDTRICVPVKGAWATMVSSIGSSSG